MGEGVKVGVGVSEGVGVSDGVGVSPTVEVNVGVGVSADKVAVSVGVVEPSGVGVSRVPVTVTVIVSGSAVAVRHLMAASVAVGLRTELSLVCREFPYWTTASQYISVFSKKSPYLCAARAYLEQESQMAAPQICENKFVACSQSNPK